MEDDNTITPESSGAEPKWRPLSSIDRRVVGVLAEKAKTTPDNYPMSLNVVRGGCNQKSNRSPVMGLEVDDVEESLDRLREMGAVGMIEGYGRVAKYRHYLYEWLGTNKVELAVMAELLLRGAQTVGELRGRAARMEPIRDLAELRPVLDALKSRGLVISLTPEGRGHVVTHGLYQPRELENLKAQYGQAAAVEPAAPAKAPSAPVAAPAAAGGADRATSDSAETLRRQLDELRSQLAELRSDHDDLAAHVQQSDDELQRLRDALGG